MTSVALFAPQQAFNTSNIGILTIAVKGKRKHNTACDDSCKWVVKVRSAGQDAWLGRAAPADPSLDDTVSSEAHLQLEDSNQPHHVDDQKTCHKHCMQLANIGALML